MFSVLLFCLLGQVSPSTTTLDRETSFVLQYKPTACWSAGYGYGVDGALRFSHSPDLGYFPSYVKQSDPIFATNQNSWGLCLSFKINFERGLHQTIVSKNNEYKVYYDTNDHKLRFIIFGANNQVVLTSNTIIDIDKIYSICCGYNVDDSNAYFKINDEPTISVLVNFIPVSGNSPFCLGWHDPYATIQAFYGIIDSLGWSHTPFTEAQMIQLNSGLRWIDIDVSLQSLFVDWYDFGNEWTHSPEQTEWDWLKSNLSNRSLEPVLIAHRTPYVVPGLFAPLQQVNSDVSALWYPDITGHGHYLLQPWYLMRTGWQKSIDRMPAFWFRGDYIVANNYYIGHYQPCWTMTSNGTNVPWSAIWIFRGQSNTQVDPPDHFLGLTLGGWNSNGFIPSRPHGTGLDVVPASSGHSVKYSLSEHYNPVWSNHVRHWVSRRQADNNTWSQIASPNASKFDTESWHCGVFVFDGFYSKFWLDGAFVFNENHTIGTNGVLVGSQVLRSFSIGGGCYGRDEMIFNPPFNSFSGGAWSWKGWQRMAACWAGQALPDTTAANLSRILTKKYIPPISTMNR